MVSSRVFNSYLLINCIPGEQDVCHRGEPDYDNLFSGRELKRKGSPLPGPETPNLPGVGENAAKPGYGRHTQGIQLLYVWTNISLFNVGGAMEHLAHVVFGFQDLRPPKPTNNDYCKHFLPNCPQSLCRG